MTDFALRRPEPQFHRNRPIAVIDIGSNSIRMVVYDGLSRTPLPVFNEKAVCGLGIGLDSSGRLNPGGVDEAFAALGRFIRLAQAMNPEILDVVATAAVRDASDGAAFVAQIKERFGIQVTTLSGEQEARCAAQGVLCATPDADGIVADLGGGSLELVALDRGQFSGPYATMPLGMLRLGESSGWDRQQASAVIDHHLGRIDWLEHGKGRPLFAVGGAWRAVARLGIAQLNHPLHVLDHFTLSAEDALRLFDTVSRQNRKLIERVPGMSRKRVDHVPLASLLLGKLVSALSPSEVIFSVYGMREGRFFSHLPQAVRQKDPLLSSCLDWAQGSGRFPEHGQELFDWMTPLFLRETQRQARLRLAACHLGDVFWSEHPDYRAEQAFLRVFRLPFMGVGHEERAMLALALHSRYEGDVNDHSLIAGALQLLPDADRQHALTVGAALRLGLGMTGAVPGLLRMTRLSLSGDALSVHLPAGDPLFRPEQFSRRLERLARIMGLPAGNVLTEGSPAF